MKYNCVPADQLNIDKIQVCHRSWETWVPPFPMGPRVYYVSGNNWVSSFLIDTGDGLILIDTAMHETLYLLLESVRALGYDPKDIKKILVSHTHFDHIGGLCGLRAVTGAKVYLDRADHLLMQEHPQCVPFRSFGGALFDPDEYYSDDMPICQGDITIRTIHTPGHTPGTTSYIFDAADDNGNVFTYGLHGGIGLKTVSRSFLEENGLPVSLQQDYLDSMAKLRKCEVDITLPSHDDQVGFLAYVQEIRPNYNPFVDKAIWPQLLDEFEGRMREMLDEERKSAS